MKVFGQQVPFSVQSSMPKLRVLASRPISVVLCRWHRFVCGSTISRPEMLPSRECATVIFITVNIAVTCSWKCNTSTLQMVVRFADGRQNFADCNLTHLWNISPKCTPVWNMYSWNVRDTQLLPTNHKFWRNPSFSFKSADFCLAPPCTDHARVCPLCYAVGMLSSCKHTAAMFTVLP